MIFARTLRFKTVNMTMIFQTDRDAKPGNQVPAQSDSMQSAIPYLLYVKNAQRQVIARLIALSFNGVIRIESLWFADPYRAKELATSLLQNLEAEALTRRCSYCFADEPDDELVNVYKELGYSARDVSIGRATKVSGLAKELTPSEETTLPVSRVVLTNITQLQL
ncbi:GNAT family N-acetyltransferase [Massilia sp. UYP11]|uniref:GNAT family N-acetyltransferase n=1 Tax=Massilia sp. UYP11 TaxID=1756385 RepID=UPI003D21D974